MYCMFLLRDRQRFSDIVELGFNFVYLGGGFMIFASNTNVWNIYNK